MNPPAEQQIRDYLNRVSLAARGRLGADDRRAFLARTRELIEQNTRALPTADSAGVAQLLASLGDPAKLVARERDRLAARRLAVGPAAGSPADSAGVPKIAKARRWRPARGTLADIMTASATAVSPGGARPAPEAADDAPMTGELRLEGRPITSRWRPGGSTERPPRQRRGGLPRRRAQDAATAGAGPDNGPGEVLGEVAGVTQGDPPAGRAADQQTTAVGQVVAGPLAEPPPPPTAPAATPLVPPQVPPAAGAGPRTQRPQWPWRDARRSADADTSAGGPAAGEPASGAPANGTSVNGSPPDGAPASGSSPEEASPPGSMPPRGTFPTWSALKGTTSHTGTSANGASSNGARASDAPAAGASPTGPILPNGTQVNGTRLNGGRPAGAQLNVARPGDANPGSAQSNGAHQAGPSDSTPPDSTPPGGACSGGASSNSAPPGDARDELQDDVTPGDLPGLEDGIAAAAARPGQPSGADVPSAPSTAAGPGGAGTRRARPVRAATVAGVARGAGWAKGVRHRSASQSGPGDVGQPGSSAGPGTPGRQATGSGRPPRRDLGRLGGVDPGEQPFGEPGLGLGLPPGSMTVFRDRAVAFSRAAASRARRQPLEAAAIVLLGLGGLIFPPIWLLGALLALASRVWDFRDKWVGLALPIFLVIAGMAAAVSLGGAHHGVSGYAREAWLFGDHLSRIVAVLGAAYLAWRAERGRRRPVIPPWTKGGRLG